MDDILTRLQPIFHDVFDREDLVIVRESNAETVDGWDSLTHINLVSAIEREFKIKFALGELQALKNVGDMVDLMKRKMSTGASSRG
jgi:acyl carrier protein